MLLCAPVFCPIVVTDLLVLLLAQSGVRYPRPNAVGLGRIDSIHVSVGYSAAWRQDGDGLSARNLVVRQRRIYSRRLRLCVGSLAVFPAGFAVRAGVCRS